MGFLNYFFPFPVSKYNAYPPRNNKPRERSNAPTANPKVKVTDTADGFVFRYCISPFLKDATIAFNLSIMMVELELQWLE